MGDILPNDDKFRYRISEKDNTISNIRLGNITLKVLNAIDSVLDMFLHIKEENLPKD